MGYFPTVGYAFKHTKAWRKRAKALICRLVKHSPPVSEVETPNNNVLASSQNILSLHLTWELVVRHQGQWYADLKVAV